MADPLLDEAAILEDLQMPVTEDTVIQMQRACCAALFDCYDRKVTRDQFVTMTSACLALYGALHKLFIINNVKASFHRDEITAPNLKVTIEAAENKVRSLCGNVQHVMELLIQCPTSQDKVH